MYAVQVLARVLLDVHARDPRSTRLTIEVERQLAARGERLVELTDLVALGQVGIEVLFARELASRADPTSERQSRADGQPHSALVDGRERSGPTQTHRAHIAVRGLSDGDGTTAKQLGARQKLRVNLEPNDRFVPCHNLAPTELTRPVGARLLAHVEAPVGSVSGWSHGTLRADPQR
jgi:hypothetical protein